VSLYKVKRKSMAGTINKDKCPRCLDGWVDFMDINGDGTLLGCYKCGCVFVSKDVRASEIEGKKEQLEKQDEELAKEKESQESEILSEQEGAYKCEICGKTFGAKIALIGHMRSHDDTSNKQE
jgi:predicted adenine nucleotide alpha hydrolase (AANH) superfamily ATPase